MSSLNLSQDVQVLPCPACGQTINTSMQVCPYCAAPIDHAAAALSAESFGKLNQSISDASYLKVMAWGVLTCFAVIFVPFFSMVGVFGLRFLEFAIPFMVIRWWVKYGKIKSPDPELRTARLTALWVGVGSIVFLFVYNIGVFFN